MTARQLRALRGVSAAFVASLIAATAHTLAGGGAPSPALVFAAGILASPAAMALVGRRLSLWRIAAAVIAGQALFHIGFALTAAADAGTGTAASAGHAHHVLPAAAPVAGRVMLDVPMMIAHLLAAALTVIALYGGERMLRAVARGIRSVLARVRSIVPPPSERVTARAESDPLRAARVFLSDASRRGPPAFV